MNAKSADDADAKPILDLVKAMDDFFPDPVRDLDKPFLMPIEDIFSIEGRGTVVTGRIERGKVKVNEEIEIVGLAPDGEDRRHRHRNVQQAFGSAVRQAITSACLLRGLKKEDVERGQVLAKPGTVTPHSEFEAEIYVLSKEEGGRHSPFFKGYKPQFYIRTTDVTGEVTLAGRNGNGHAGRYREDWR